MKIFNTLLFNLILWALMACQSNYTEPSVNLTSHKQVGKEVVVKHNEKDSISIPFKKEEIEKLSYQQALVKYQTPINKEEFILGQNLTEFRIELYNHFTEKQIKSNKIRILEITWNYDSEKNITSWYVMKDGNKPIDVALWEKDALF